MHPYLTLGVYPHIINIVAMIIVFAVAWVEIPSYIVGKQKKNRILTKSYVQDHIAHDTVTRRIGNSLAALDSRIEKIKTQRN